ncbi:transcription factor A, mitochondrial-like [Artemia franciscana]|uniref:transcription factor A, mitochondrial-like n=1 Tax=Artemia franciscana TaxID=6661 RepID=UPI0032DB4B79
MLSLGLRQGVHRFSIGSQGFQFAWQSGTPSRSKGFEVSEHLPKRPQPQYMKFLNEKRKTLKAENPNWSRSEIFAACCKMWKEMSDEEKAKYPSPSKEELEEYKRKKEEYLMQLTPDELRSFDVVMMQKKAKEALERILNAPKRPGTPYALFLQDKKGEKQPNFAEFARNSALEWKNLPPEEKVKYQLKHDALADEYKEGYADWLKSVESVVRSLLPKDKKSKAISKEKIHPFGPLE